MTAAGLALATACALATAGTTTPAQAAAPAAAWSASVAAPVPTDRAAAGAVLPAGRTLTSPNGHYRAVMQGDGNFVVYGSYALFGTGTIAPGARLAVQGDGNVVVYLGGRPLWASGTRGSGTVLVMQNDGNLVLYATGGRALWATNTYSRVLFSDGFSTPVARGNFLRSPYAPSYLAYTGRDTSGHGIYDPNRVLSVHDGVLDYYLHTEAGAPRVAALVPLPGGRWGGQRYGTYTVRFRADALPNYKVAFLLWPDSNNWSQGEIDFPEGPLNGTFYAASLRTGTPATRAGAHFDGVTAGASFAAWHTATTVWAPGRVTWYLDGRPIGSTAVATPTSPMHMVLQVETMDAGAPAPAPSVAGHVYVDGVTISSIG